MKTFVARANIEHYAGQLSIGAVNAVERATIMRLLVEEEDKFGAGHQQLGQCDLWIASGQRLIANQRTLIAHLKKDGNDARSAEQLLESMIGVQALFNEYRERLLRELADGPL